MTLTALRAAMMYSRKRSPKPPLKRGTFAAPPFKVNFPQADMKEESICILSS